MYYLESNKGIINILANLFLDYNTNKIKGVQIKELFEWLSDNENNFIDMISGITATTNPLGLSGLSFANKYFTRITLDEIIKVKNNISDIKSEILKKSFTDDFNRIYRKLPFDIVSLYDKKINKQINIFKLFKNNKHDSIETIHQNNRDSVMYLTDIYNLDRDIEVSRKSNMFTDNELSKLYSLTVRLILPKHFADMIKCTHKSEFLYKSDDNRIMFSDKNNTNQNINGVDLSKYRDEIRKITDEGNRHLDKLSDDVLYKVYLNVTIKELSDIINDLSDIEFSYDAQVLGAVYYNLINFKNINDLFTIDEECKRNIEKRIFTRRGN